VQGCPACKRRKLAGPYDYPEMPDLPKERSTRARPFEHCGVDYLGPLHIVVDNKEKKVWVALFACMVTRAIHLEAVEDLSAASFLNAMRRFVARRGRPSLVISDHGTTFVLAREGVKHWKGLEDEEVQNYLAHEDIEWRMIPPRAPHQGGFYERMVGLVKEALKGAMQFGPKPSRDAFATLLAEAEAVVNARPLVADEGHILRPADFLLPLAHTGVPVFEGRSDLEEAMEEETARAKLLETWADTTRTLDKFWKIWHELYLTEMREKQAHTLSQPRSTTKQSPRNEDDVLITDDRLPRDKQRITFACLC